LDKQITSLEDYLKKQFPQAGYVVIKDVKTGLNEEDEKGLKKPLNYLKENKWKLLLLIQRQINKVWLFLP